MPREAAGVLSVAWLNIFTKAATVLCHGKGPVSFRGVVKHIH